MRELERRVILSVLDTKWREHLYEMDYLREGISLRAMAQRDPLIEYQREGYELFNGMMEAIKEESVGNLFHLQVEVQQDPIVGEAGPDGEWAEGAAVGVQDAPPAVNGGRPSLAPRAGSLRVGRRQDSRPRRRRQAGPGDGEDAVPAAFAPRAGPAQAARPAQLQRTE